MTRARRLAHAAVLAALYAALTQFQNLLLPGSAAWAVQLRLSEALCVLAFFTPAAVPGLAAGCLITNLASGGALPLDFAAGTLATLFAAWGMHRLRRLPVLGLLLPALCNGLLVGWELTVYVGGCFWMNAGYVALGELIVLFTLGSALYHAIRRRGLDRKLFGTGAVGSAG